MIILGLDLAIRTGWSAFEINDDLKQPYLLDCGLIDCFVKPSRVAGVGSIIDEGLRFHKLREGVKFFMGEWTGIGCVYYERPVGGPTAGGAAAKIALGMTAIIQELCYTHSLLSHPVATGTLKKHATGHGGPETRKPHMIAAAIKQFGKQYMRRVKPTASKPWIYDDNIADALWVGHFGACDMGDIKFPGIKTTAKLAFQ